MGGFSSLVGTLSNSQGSFCIGHMNCMLMAKYSPLSLSQTPLTDSAAGEVGEVSSHVGP